MIETLPLGIETGGQGWCLGLLQQPQAEAKSDVVVDLDVPAFKHILHPEGHSDLEQVPEAQPQTG